MNDCTRKNRLHDLAPGNWVPGNWVPGNWVPASWNDFDALLNQVLAPTAARNVRGVRAPLGVWEADDAYHVELDLPGVLKEDIEVSFEKGALNITAQRKGSEDERKGLHEERVYGQVKRSLNLSESRSRAFSVNQPGPRAGIGRG